ncbi:MAG: hypothetical protein IPL96_07510 [Holophagaceae bacterium]|nr:hypothetical protein [Holophagaceae bacterium]
MPHKQTYAVLLFKEALEALGEAIKPFLRSGQFGDFIPCQSVDTNGPLCTLVVDTRSEGSTDMTVELQIPYPMIKLIVGSEVEGHAGFHHA